MSNTVYQENPTFSLTWILESCLKSNLSYYKGSIFLTDFTESLLMPPSPCSVNWNCFSPFVFIGWSWNDVWAKHRIYFLASSFFVFNMSRIFRVYTLIMNITSIGWISRVSERISWFYRYIDGIITWTSRIWIIICMFML